MLTQKRSDCKELTHLNVFIQCEEKAKEQPLPSFFLKRMFGSQTNTEDTVTGEGCQDIS